MTKSSEVYTCVGSGTFQNYTQVFSRERSKNKLDFEGKEGDFLLALLGPGRDLLRENRANPDIAQGLQTLTHKLKERVSGPKASGQDNLRQ